MSIPDLTSRVATRVSSIEERLRVDAWRWTVIITAGLVALLGHRGLVDPRMAWLAVLAVAAAGLGGSAREGFAVGLGSAALHLGVDVLIEVDATEILGIGLRSVALPLIGLFAAALAHVERLRSEAQERSATEDSVTGLLNVRAFYDGLATLAGAETPHAVVLLDIVGMSGINERWGHPTGTEAVRALGHVLRRAVGEDALIGRLGSDVVAVVLVATSRPVARLLAVDFLNEVERETLFVPDGSELHLKVTWGVAVFPEDADDAVSLLREAQHDLDRYKEERAQTPGGRTVETTP